MLISCSFLCRTFVKLCMLVILLNTDRKSIPNCLASIALLYILLIFAFQFFKMANAKSAIFWKILNLILYIPFHFHLILLHWKKECGSCTEFWPSQLCQTVAKQCFCRLFFFTGGEAIWGCVITWWNCATRIIIKQIEVWLIDQLVEYRIGIVEASVRVPFRPQLFIGWIGLSTG